MEETCSTPAPGGGPLTPAEGNLGSRLRENDNAGLHVSFGNGVLVAAEGRAGSSAVEHQFPVVSSPFPGPPAFRPLGPSALFVQQSKG